MARIRLTQSVDGLVIDCVLSQRNALSLISQLATAGSLREFICQDVPPGVAYARIRIEPDQIHYNSPGRHGAGPGAMHPITERILRAINDAIAAEPNPADLHQPDGPS